MRTPLSVIGAAVVVAAMSAPAWAMVDVSPVADEIHAHHHEIAACYDELLSRREVAGRVQFELVIEPSGEVSRAAVVATTIDDATMERCVLSVMYRFRFPSRADEAGSYSVTFPIVFRPQIAV